MYPMVQAPFNRFCVRPLICEPNIEGLRVLLSQHGFKRSPDNCEGLRGSLRNYQGYATVGRRQCAIWVMRLLHPANIQKEPGREGIDPKHDDRGDHEPRRVGDPLVKPPEKQADCEYRPNRNKQPINGFCFWLRTSCWNAFTFTLYTSLVF